MSTAKTSFTEGMQRAGQRGGMGLAGWLGLAFVVLKLTGYITWPWLWVLAPFWIPFALVGVILLIVGVVAAIAVSLRK